MVFLFAISVCLLLHGKTSKTSADWQLHGKTSAADHAGSPTMQAVSPCGQFQIPAPIILSV